MIPDLSEFDYLESRQFSLLTAAFAFVFLVLAIRFFRDLISPKTGQSGERWFPLAFAAAPLYPVQLTGLFMGKAEYWNSLNVVIGFHIVTALIAITLFHTRFFLNWKQSARAYFLSLILTAITWPFAAHAVISLINGAHF